MSKPVMYRQCELRAPTGDGQGVRRHVAWLPAKHRTGDRVRIDSEPGDWTIIEAGEARPEEIVLGYEANGRRGLPSVSGRADLEPA